MLWIPENNLLMANGHDLDRQQLLTDGRQWLIDHELSPAEADAAIETVRVEPEMWWAPQAAGFCGPEYPGAEPVTSLCFWPLIHPVVV